MTGERRGTAARAERPSVGSTAVMPDGRVVLVVDDDEVARHVARGYLTRLGWHVVEASDGLEGLELAFSTPPAAVLLALQMPELDGLEVLRYLRQYPGTRGTVVVVQTGRDLSCDQWTHVESLGAEVLRKDQLNGTGALEHLSQVLQDAARRAIQISREGDS